MVVVVVKFLVVFTIMEKLFIITSSQRYVETP